MVTSISGIKFNDLNGNGVQDKAEAGLADFTIELIDSIGEVVAVSTTNASGFYEFTDLEPETYILSGVAPPDNELNFQLTLGEESVIELNFATIPITEVTGSAGKDILTGTDGFDLIIAGEQEDKLYGFAGDDTLEGDAGRDTLSGGAGNDILTGGSEQDMFVLAAGKDADVITDFEPGVDYFFGAEQLSFEDLSFVGNSILLEETSEILATVEGLDTTTLTPGDFLTFYTPLQCCELLIA